MSREDALGFGVKLPPTTARAIELAAEIMGGAATEPAFLHSVFASCGLPYRAVPGRDYIRRSGRAALIISAGMLLDPNTREPVVQGVPYGTRPRLLLAHLCSEAIRRQSPTVPIAESMSAFMRELGISPTGGAKGSISMFKAQLNRLAASRMQLLWDGGDFQTLVNPAPVIHRFDVWFPGDARQRMLWPSEVTLSGEFFESLQRHALPLDPRALRALMHNARSMDVYTWLVARLPRVKSNQGDRVSWAALHQQFGPDLRDRRDFRRAFATALRLALAVYPAAKVEVENGGLRLRASRPAIAFAGSASV